MNVKDLGKRTTSTPPYQLTGEKNAKQHDVDFQDKGNRQSFKDSQDLMGGPQRRDIASLSHEERAEYINGRIKDAVDKLATNHYND